MQPAHLPWRRVVQAFAAAAVVVLALGLLSQYSKYYLGHDHWRGILPRLDLNAERSLPAGFSALLIGATATAAALAAVLERARRSRWTGHWVVLAAVLALMSIEEVADFHTVEIIPREPAVALTGFLHMTWVLLAVPFVLAFAVAYFRFWRSMAPATRRRFLLAGAVYVGGALLMEMVGGRYFVASGEVGTFGLQVVLAVEEALEMAGMLLLLAAIFHHLETSFGTVMLSFAGAPARARAAEREVPVPVVPFPDGVVPGVPGPVPAWASADETRPTDRAPSQRGGRAD